MSAHHLEIDHSHLTGNRGVGRYVLLPGSPGRAALIGDLLDDHRVVSNRRRMDVHLGRHQGIDIAVVPTGMGCPSVDIVATELLHLGARRLLRVGTTGSMQPTVLVGDVVIATGAVRDESTSDVYTPRGFPAVADPLWVQALTRAALDRDLADQVHLGLVHTKDSFFGREFAEGPDASRNEAYMERLVRAGVVATEMEAAHLFVLGEVHGTGTTSLRARLSSQARVRCGAILAVIGSPESGIASIEIERATEARMIELALAGVVQLAALEG